MNTYQIMTVFFSIAAVLIIGSISPALATDPEDLRCNGIINKGTYNNVKVAKGDGCILNNVTVKGNVNAVYATGVLLVNTTIEGNVNIKHTSGVVLLQKAYVGGNVNMIQNDNGAFFTGISASTIDGNVQFTHTPNAGLFIRDNEIGGNLNCNNNDPISGLLTNTVTGEINCN